MKTHRAIRFHIKNDDYFGTLATLLELLREDLAKCGYSKKEVRLLASIREDLMYLQQHYEVVRKK